MATVIRNLFIMSIVLCCIFLAWSVYNIENRFPEKSYDFFLQQIENKAAEHVDVTGIKAEVQTTSGLSFRVYLGEDSKWIDRITASKTIEVTFHRDFSPYYFQGGLVAVAALVLVIFFPVYRKKQNGDDLQFAKDHLVRPSNSSNTIRFDDVAGIPDAKEELKEVVVFLKTPETFEAVGATIPRGLLLQGPPGTGKTLLARAIAGEAGVPFYNFSGSDFVEMFAGVGASRVRDLFTEAKQNAPCIIFIDEIDAVGGHRTGGATDGNDERGQTLNALLVEMDGFSTTDNVMVLAATNRPDILDPALRRPGRFDRQITILAPDLRGRIEILKTHCKKVKLADDVDIAEIAHFSSGFTGAEIASLVNEAALLTAREGRCILERSSFDQARDRILLGIERKGMVLTEEDKKILAYHEAGHAIVAKLLPEADPIHKITIIPRGRSMGQTQQLPLGDRYAYGKGYLIDRTTTLLGGRAAEKIIFNEFSTRTENDLIQATDIATNIVCRWGMSESLGPQAHVVEESGFLDNISRRRVMSDETAGLIDQEVKDLLNSCYERALKILKQEEYFLNVLSEILMDMETLDSEEFEIIHQCSLVKREETTVEKDDNDKEWSFCPVRGQGVKKVRSCSA